MYKTKQRDKKRESKHNFISGNLLYFTLELLLFSILFYKYCKFFLYETLLCYILNIFISFFYEKCSQVNFCKSFSQKSKKKTKLHFYQYYFYIAWSDFPELLVLHTVPSQSRVQTVLFTQCVWSWSQESQTTFTIVKLMLLYTLPLLFMSVAYWRIVRVLWKSNIPGHNRKQKITQFNHTVTNYCMICVSWKCLHGN